MGLPVPESRLLVALRAEARALARANPMRLRRAGCEVRDLVQSGALGYLRALDHVTAATQHVQHPHAYAMAAARGAMRDLLRHGEPPAPLVTLVDAHDAAPAPHMRAPSRVGLRALPRRVRRAIGRLPATQQQTLRLTLQGRGPQEIARIVGVTENTISLRKHGALTTLRARLAAAAA